MRADLKRSMSTPLPSSRKWSPRRGVECSSQGYVICEVPLTGVAVGVIDLWTQSCYGFQIIDGEDTTNVRIQSGRARQNADDEESKSFPARLGTMILVENEDGSPGVDSVSIRISAASTTTLTVVVFTRRPLCCPLDAVVLRGPNGETITSTNPLPVQVFGAGAATPAIVDADNLADFAAALLGMVVNARLGAVNVNTGDYDRLRAAPLNSAVSNETSIALLARAAITGRDSAAGAGSQNTPVEARAYDADADVVSTLVGMLVNSRLSVFDGTDWRRIETALTSDGQRIKTSPWDSGLTSDETTTPLGGAATFTGTTRNIPVSNALALIGSPSRALFDSVVLSCVAFADVVGTIRSQVFIAGSASARNLTDTAVLASVTGRQDQRTLGARQCRAQYVNGAGAQGTFEFGVATLAKVV